MSMSEFAKGLNCIKGLNYRIFYFFLQIYNNNIQFYHFFNPPENIYYTYEFEEKNKFQKKKINIILTHLDKHYFSILFAKIDREDPC